MDRGGGEPRSEPRSKALSRTQLKARWKGEDLKRRPGLDWFYRNSAPFAQIPPIVRPDSAQLLPIFAKSLLRFSPSFCPDSALILPGFCPGFAQILPRFCPDPDQFLPGSCPVSAQFLSTFCPDSAQILPGSCPVFARVLPSFCPGSAHILPGFCAPRPRCQRRRPHWPPPPPAPGLSAGRGSRCRKICARSAGGPFKAHHRKAPRQIWDAGAPRALHGDAASSACFAPMH